MKHAGMHKVVSRILGHPHSWSYHYSFWATSATNPRACIEVNEDNEDIVVFFSYGREKICHKWPSASLVEYLALRVKEMMPDEPR